MSVNNRHPASAHISYFVQIFPKCCLPRWFSKIYRIRLCLPQYPLSPPTWWKPTARWGAEKSKKQNERFIKNIENNHNQSTGQSIGPTGSAAGLYLALQEKVFLLKRSIPLPAFPPQSLSLSISLGHSLSLCFSPNDVSVAPTNRGPPWIMKWAREKERDRERVVRQEKQEEEKEGEFDELRVERERVTGRITATLATTSTR